MSGVALLPGGNDVLLPGGAFLLLPGGSRAGSYNPPFTVREARTFVVRENRALTITETS